MFFGGWWRVCGWWCFDGGLVGFCLFVCLFVWGGEEVGWWGGGLDTVCVVLACG